MHVILCLLKPLCVDIACTLITIRTNCRPLFKDTQILYAVLQCPTAYRHSPLKIFTATLELFLAPHILVAVIPKRPPEFPQRPSEILIFQNSNFIFNEFNFTIMEAKENISKEILPATSHC